MVQVLLNGLLLTNNYSGVQYSIEYFVDSLSRARSVNHRFTVLVSESYVGSLKASDSLVIKKIGFDTANRMKRIWFENFILPKFFAKNGFDLYHSLGYTLPFFSNIPSIVTVHDLIALDFPTLCKNETALYFNTFIPRSLKTAKKIIAVSSTVKSDILNKFPNIPEHKVEVVYHGLHSRFIRVQDTYRLVKLRTKYNLPDSFFLFVGNIEPKKNLINLIKAFIYLKRTYNIAQKLLIVGAKGWKYSDIFDYCENSPLKNEMIFLGYINEDELPSLYTLAELFIFPSYYEGFGLPVLEAMSCGCPVIISNRGALPEISGGLCLQFNPDSVEEIAKTILKTITNTNVTKDRIDKSIKWSKGFNWDVSGAQALRIYSSLKTSLYEKENL